MKTITLKKILIQIITVGVIFLILGLVPFFLLRNRQPNSSFLSPTANLYVKKEYQDFRMAETQKLTQPNDFSADKIPQFRIRTDMPLNKFKGRVRIINTWNGRQANLAFEVTEEGKDKVIKLEKGANFNPGAYKLEIIDFYGQNLEQNFTWGVLALNLDKSSYLPGENAEIYMTVLNDAGETECQAEINLKVTTPTGKEFNLSTQNGSIVKSNECQPKNFTYKPDFRAIFTDTKEKGRYQLVFEAKNKNGTRKIEDFLEVKSNSDFVITRQSATRIFPPSEYEMKIKVIPKIDFIGEIQEILPASFNVFSQEAKIELKDNYKILAWSVKLVKNQEYALSYNFNAPDISPEFYFLGPLKFFPTNGINRLEKIFEEPRAWQLAADAVPSNIIVAWPGTVASLPAGWTRDATLDGKFLKGTAALTDPGGTGGASSHAHTVSNHSHTHTAHTHSVTVANVTTADSVSVGTTTAALWCGKSHNHLGTFSSTSASYTDNAAATALVADAGTSLPPYFDVIWIYSGGTTAIPASAVAFYNSTTVPNANWTLYANLNGKFPRGAAAGVGGGGTGGASSHTHTNAAHGHGIPTHSHTAVTGAANTSVSGQLSTVATANTVIAHTHNITLAAYSPTQATNTFTVSADAGNSLPPYYDLAPIQNTSVAADQPQNIIAMWRGTLANIPAGWILCDGGSTGTPDLRGKFVRGNTAAVGGTGGSTGHGHTSTGHTHTMTAHNHTASMDYPAQSLKKLGTQYWPAHNIHTHPITVANNTSGDAVDPITVTIQTNADTQPPFYTVAFIQFKANAPSGCSVVESLTNNNLTLYWTYIEANEDSFQIYRNDNGAGFVSLGTAVADATSYLDNTTLSGHTYAYEVRAVYGATYSSWCVTPTYDTLIGNFKFEGVKMEGIKINFLRWFRQYFKIFLAIIKNLFKTAYAKAIAN